MTNDIDITARNLKRVNVFAPKPFVTKNKQESKPQYSKDNYQKQDSNIRPRTSSKPKDFEKEEYQAYLKLSPEAKLTVLNSKSQDLRIKELKKVANTRPLLVLKHLSSKKPYSIEHKKLSKYIIRTNLIVALHFAFQSKESEISKPENQQKKEFINHVFLESTKYLKELNTNSALTKMVITKNPNITTKTIIDSLQYIKKDKDRLAVIQELADNRPEESFKYLKNINTKQANENELRELIKQLAKKHTNKAFAFISSNNFSQKISENIFLEAIKNAPMKVKEQKILESISSSSLISVATLIKASKEIKPESKQKIIHEKIAKDLTTQSLEFLIQGKRPKKGSFERKTFINIGKYIVRNKPKKLLKFLMQTHPGLDIKDRKSPSYILLKQIFRKKPELIFKYYQTHQSKFVLHEAFDYLAKPKQETTLYKYYENIKEGISLNYVFSKLTNYDLKKMPPKLREFVAKNFPKETLTTLAKKEKYSNGEDLLKIALASDPHIINEKKYQAKIKKIYGKYNIESEEQAQIETSSKVMTQIWKKYSSANSILERQKILNKQTDRFFPEINKALKELNHKHSYSFKLVGMSHTPSEFTFMDFTNRLALTLARPSVINEKGLILKTLEEKLNNKLSNSQRISQETTWSSQINLNPLSSKTSVMIVEDPGKTQNVLEESFAFLRGLQKGFIQNFQVSEVMMKSNREREQKYKVLQRKYSTLELPEIKNIKQSNIVNRLKHNITQAIDIGQKDFLLLLKAHGSTTGNLTINGEDFQSKEVAQALSSPYRGKDTSKFSQPLASLIKVHIYNDSCYGEEYIRKLVSDIQNKKIKHQDISLLAFADRNSMNYTTQIHSKFKVIADDIHKSKTHTHTKVDPFTYYFSYLSQYKRECEMHHIDSGLDYNSIVQMSDHLSKSFEAFSQPDPKGIVIESTSEGSVSKDST